MYMKKDELLQYFDAHLDLFTAEFAELCAIPAPSHHEEKRVSWVMEWLRKNGIVGAYTDEALNVVLPLGDTSHADIFMAHTDVVFPDTEPLPVEVHDGCLYAPGAGDDTANLLILLWAVRYLLQKGAVPKGGVVICANSCEEGLGNLKGVRKLMETYSGRVDSLVTLDGHLGGIVDHAVGSQRYRITLRTEGGHSYSNFGNKNAIREAAAMIEKLYSVTVPTEWKTTYNVGSIEGGTSVNTIAQECRFLYEFRSEDRNGLAFMEKEFQRIITETEKSGTSIAVETVGIRPCGGDVDPGKLKALFEHTDEIQYSVTGAHCKRQSGSTDANIPLSLGVPAICAGVVKRGAGAHTREEWVELPSLREGFAFAGLLLGEKFR